jgi:hypothetical protein
MTSTGDAVILESMSEQGHPDPTDALVRCAQVPSRQPIASAILLTRFIGFVSLQICKIGTFAP